MVRTPGVGRRSGGPSQGASSTGAGTEVARSTLPAYPQARQTAMKSSPASLGIMNSTDSDPPMTPEEACTGMGSRPVRRKMRV